ncbi:MAG: hypothetical protein HC814_02925, partial [Rhodobacteraceae bacterium]|nr:hypothetical protein [Paracoccaceae bacterium]
KRTNTCMPGIVVSFNRTLRTADVQPAPKRKLVGQAWQDMQVIKNCPVSYPAGGRVWYDLGSRRPGMPACSCLPSVTCFGGSGGVR